MSRGPSATDPCDICNSSEHWRKDCPHKGKDKGKGKGNVKGNGRSTGTPGKGKDTIPCWYLLQGQTCPHKDKPGGCWFKHTDVTKANVAPKSKAKATPKAGNTAPPEGSTRQQSIDKRVDKVVDPLIKDKGNKGVKKKDIATAAAAVRSRSAGNVAISIAHRSMESVVRPDPQLAAVTKRDPEQLLADLHDTITKLGTIIAEINKWPAHEVANRFPRILLRQSCCLPRPGLTTRVHDTT